MAFIVTRAEIVARVRREAHRAGDTGTGNDRDLHAIAVDKLREWHFVMAADSQSGVGKAVRELVVTTPGPTFDLPTEFLTLKAWTRDDISSTTNARGVTSPVRVLPAAFITFDFDTAGNEPRGKGVYYIEGPGKEFDTGLGQLMTYPQRLRVSPDFAANATIKLLYISQAPDFGDPNNAADDSTQIDVINAMAYNWIAQLVRLVFVGRGDTDEYRRALQAASEATVAGLDARDSQDEHRSIDPSAYLRRGGTDGYW